MKKVNYDNQPAAIEAVGNGLYLYRWAIAQVEVDSTEEQETRTLWECYEVTIGATPSQDVITAQVIDALWGGGVEQKLLNDYQAASVGLLDEEYAEPYINFLAERQACKMQIDSDVAQWMSAM